MIDYFWSSPDLVDVIENSDSIELVYTQDSLIHPPLNGKRVYKIVYSVVNGKWHKSEPIFGSVIEPTKESYEFN